MKDRHLIIREQKNEGYTPTYEFHVSRVARDLYQFDERIFSSSGNVVFADFRSARDFANRMNARKDLVHFPERVVHAGEINALALIDEILHFILSLYKETVHPALFPDVLRFLETRYGKKAIDETLVAFVREFPAAQVYKHNIDAESYLLGDTNGVPNREIVLEELLLLWVTNKNPAARPFRELFDDSSLKSTTSYKQIIAGLYEYFSTQQGFGPGKEHVIYLLRSPALASPYSLFGQLEFIQAQWGYLIGKFLHKILMSLDLIKEETAPRFGGPGPAAPPVYTGESEEERYSPDRDWMPRVVMIAKSTLVWLSQLSEAYERPIRHLDDIPNEELDLLAARGFNALWLIGLWQRSNASKVIKRLCGNPEAEASAYSVYDYDIAPELGGWQAFSLLKERCSMRGIRLAGDMVPNHTGIDAAWVYKHPEWFIQLPYPPFPGYTYTGQNLSENKDIGIFIEDHYYDRKDAAVTFKRLDYRTGDVRYIYHGNDGTHMPWNDTAQLNYLSAEVREAVIRTIIHVARHFPIIRFDAAMTLAKKHIQRLWYPEPGTGGDIPSRSEFGMTKAEFDRLLPNEFWREVVDRVSVEAPDTLLLAEAFWFMEGYFVRSLGMHRVYNSAFMNMLKNEENAKYRDTIKNTLAFDPEILKRYVNFMNNPDEETAVEQFGKGDKYFGVCTMMVTMPGLPMFGHGQIEGFTEKYGMEYRCAYKREKPDQGFIEAHERFIFPLLKKRGIFSQVDNFRLYDVVDVEGQTNENVFAFSNWNGKEAFLIVYNNSLSRASGTIRETVPYIVRNNDGSRTLIRSSLSEELHLHNEGNTFTVMRETRSGLTYLRKSSEIVEQGLFLCLEGYQCQIYTDVYEVRDTEEGYYAQLEKVCGGRGIENLNRSLKEISFAPIYTAFEHLADPSILSSFRKAVLAQEFPSMEMLADFESRYEAFLSSFVPFIGSPPVCPPQEIVKETMNALNSIVSFMNRHTDQNGGSRNLSYIRNYLVRGLELSQETPIIFYFWLILKSTGRLFAEDSYAERSREILSEFFLSERMYSAFTEAEIEESRITRCSTLIQILVEKQNWYADMKRNKLALAEHMNELFSNPDVIRFLGIHRYEGVLWFHKESYEDLIWWLSLVAFVQVLISKSPEAEKDFTDIFDLVVECLSAEDVSSFKVEKLLMAFKGEVIDD